MNAIILTVISLFMATNDVDQIVALAGPALDIIYPIVIVLIILTLLGKMVKHDFAVAMTVYVTLAISLLTTIGSFMNLTALTSALNYLPLQSSGFGWLLPAVITFIIVNYFVKHKA